MITDNTYETGKRVFHARRAYRVVDDFEAELCSYTGAPFAVAVNSCTNALLLALTRAQDKYGDDAFPPSVAIPRKTYIGVLQSILNAGYEPRFWDGWTQGWYELVPTGVIDAARYFQPGLFPKFAQSSVCLSFHAAKQLPIGRGGAILTDDGQAAEWFRAARMDGRAPGDVRDPVFPAFHCPMPPDVAARGLDILSRWNDRGYSPPPLPHEDYEDLSQWYPTKGSK